MSMLTRTGHVTVARMARGDFDLDSAATEEALRLTAENEPKRLPAGWRRVERTVPVLGVTPYFVKNDGLTVLLSAMREQDGKHWLHVSMSRQKRLPTYGDLREVKDVFVGADRAALQVFPKRAQHVNDARFVLHLWCCLDGDVTPDFTRGNNTL